MENFADQIFRGQGPVFIGDIDANDNPINLKYVGDVSAATINSNITRGKHVESHTGSRGTAGTWISESDFQLSLTMHSIRPQHLKQAIQGNLTELTGTTVTDEAFIGSHDGFSPLAHVKISSVTITDSTGTTTYTEGAGNDYILHADTGMIEVLSTGTITDGESLLADYTYADQYSVTTNPQNIAKYVVFAGMNSANDDKQVRVECYRAKFDPGSLPLITTDAAGITLNAGLERDSSRAAGDQYYGVKAES